MRLYAEAEEEILAQQILPSHDEVPIRSEMKVAMKAARRDRRNSRKIAARFYDGLQSEASQGYTC